MRFNRTPWALALAGAVALAACNAPDPVAPADFVFSEVYGVWKFRPDPDACVGDLELRIGPFTAVEQPPDSIRLTGSWFPDEDEFPNPRDLSGRMNRITGSLELTLDEGITMTGIFLTGREALASYAAPAQGCLARMRGLRVGDS